ncbi:MAG: hypothetical protein AAF570_27745, partial [Bacteroidota bacterium]
MGVNLGGFPFRYRGQNRINEAGFPQGAGHQFGRNLQGGALAGTLIDFKIRGTFSAFDKEGHFDEEHVFDRP